MGLLYQIKRIPVRIAKRLLRIFSPALPDSFYLKACYRLKLGKRLNLKHSRTFQEKIQWMKLYFRNPQQTVLADKVAVKDWLKNIIPQEHIIPTLGVYKSFDEINFDKLPDAFVLKTNHGFGNTSICYDKNTFDYGRAREKLTNGLKRNYYLWTREWAYKNISPRIIAEPLLAHNIPDYKWWCFDGEPKYCEIIQSRWADSPMTTDFFDVNWQHQEFIGLDIRYQSSQELIEKPATFDIQLSLAQILCKGFPFVRVDLYDVNGQVFVGEMTFYPTSGIGRFLPEKYDYILGDMITLPTKKTDKL